MSTIQAIENELKRLGWLCTDQQPTQYLVEAEDHPRGWVRLYDDYSEIVAPAEEILDSLRKIEVGADYGLPCEEHWMTDS